MLLCEPPTDSTPHWIVVLRDGNRLAWTGFTSGPIVLDDDEIAAAAHDLLDLDPAAVPAAAAAALRPHVAGAGPRPPSVLLHSATQTTRGFEGDLNDVLRGNQPYDVAGYLEARVVSLAAPGDVAVGRLAPWREATEHFGVPGFDVGDCDRYYLSHALLLAAQRHDRAPVAALTQLVGWMAEHPSAVVRLYALDVETQIFLLWLAVRAGLDAIAVDANVPVVAQRWNRKNGLHPTVAAARQLPAASDTPGWLAAEQRASECAQLLGMHIPVLPGYRVVRGPDPDTFVTGVLTAADLLTERHGITRGCLKPCEAGDGARIVAGLELADRARLARHARDAHPHGDDYLLEAHLEFPTFTAAGHPFIVAPSGHIRGGRVADGLTVQLMLGCAWEGNVLVDRAAAPDIGIPVEAYDLMTAGMHSVLGAFDGPQADAQGCAGGLVLGGVDFGFGRIGGYYGDADQVGVIDLNLSSHGAEYMRAFHDEVRSDLPDAYVATRIFRPTEHATLAATDKVVRDAAPAGQRARTVACVALRWGMVATTGPAPITAVETALGLVQALAGRGLAAR